MAIDGVQTKTSVDVNGNTYTSAVSNDEMTNEDYLTLMLEELKMQDPTEPVDSSSMLDDQMQMSTIDSNTKMAESMEALRASYANSSLSTAAGLIGKVIGNGEMGEDGLTKSYKVESVTQEDGELYINARRMTGTDDDGQILYAQSTDRLPMSSITEVRDSL